MKNKTNISIIDNVGIRRNATIEIGRDGNYQSGVILDANATAKMIEDELSSSSAGAHQDIATVAISGSYNDLIDKPTIPTNISDLNNDLGYTTNEGTITKIVMNGNIISTSGVADLGTVITAHQSLSNYVTKSEFETALDDSLDWYGIVWEGNGSNLKRVGNMNMHRTLPIQSKMRRCMLEDSGIVHGYISSSDYTKYEDGTTVDYSDATYQYQVEIPEYRFDAYSYNDGTVTKHLLKLYPYGSNGTLSRKVYVGAVEATTDDADTNAVTKKMYSTCSNDAKYNNGFPKTNLKRDDFRTRAKNRGNGWSQQYWDAYMAVVRLYVVEYCNFNSQADYNSNTTEDGFKQGGLGIGVSGVNSTLWNNYNSDNPFVPCGVTNSLGNNTGVISYTDSTLGTVNISSYRGIENPFGHIWKWIDGININESSGTITVYTCNEPSKFADDTSSNYTARVSFAKPSNGFISAFNWDSNGDFIPTATGGTDKSCLYDYSYWNTGWRALVCGGCANIGSSCGWFCFRACHVSGVVGAAFGGRLYYTPGVQNYES